MSATIVRPTFGDPAAVRASAVGAAAFNRAMAMGYSRTTAQQFSRVAKRDALPSETPSAVAMRIVPLRAMSATRPHSGPTRPAA